jgi:hypothetical protein
MNLKRIALYFLPVITISLTGCFLFGYDSGGHKIVPQATGYRIFENKVYFDNGEKDVLLPLAKADSFQILQQTGWAKDAKDVFYKGVLKPEVDAPTFEVLGNYARDKQYVYDSFGNILPNALPDSFKVISGRYASDKQRVYSYDEVLPNALPDSFELLLPDGDARDKRQVISNVYARDKQQVYFDNKVLSNALPESFELLNVAATEGYARDKRQVYFNGTALTNVQYKSFELLGMGYTRDRQKVYYVPSVTSYGDLPIVVVGADAETFQVLKRFGLGQDKNNCYQYGKVADLAECKQ